MSEFEDDYPCIGVCAPDPETGLCIGCGRPLLATEESGQDLQSTSFTLAAERTTTACGNTNS